MASVVCTGLSACQFPQFGAAKAPVGQVVATVDGQEITVRGLNAELGGFATADPNVRAAAASATLRAIISRTILANAARA